MSALLTEGQARLQPIARAIEALCEGDGVDVEGLLWAWRQLQPRCHRGASDAGIDAIDVAAIVDVLGRRPRLFENGTLAPLGVDDGPDGHSGDEPRGTPLRQRMARALADACTLGLERQKLLHGLAPTASSLKQHFASPDVARDTLQALIDADVPQVTPLSDRAGDAPWPPAAVLSLLSPLSPLLSSSATTSGRVVHLLLGDVGRALDVVSPCVRRLRVELALLGRDGASPQAARVDDDDVYRGLDRLDAREPGCVAERRAHPDEFADDGAVFVVDTRRLHEDAVDRRARSLVPALKKKNAIVVGVSELLLLPSILRALRPTSIQILASSSSSSSSFPSALLDGTGAVLPLPGDGPPALSVPWAGLLPIDLDVAGLVAGIDAHAWAAAVWRARIVDDGLPAPTLRLVADRDRSTCALQAWAHTTPSTSR